MAVLGMLLLLVLMIGTFGAKLVIFPLVWEQWRAQTRQQRSRGLKFIAVVCTVAIPGAVVVVVAPFGANDSLVWTLFVYVVLVLVWGLEVAFVEWRRASRRAREAKAGPTAAGASRRR
jgi:hypothetical protein